MTRRYLVDLLERVVATFIEAFCGALMVGGYLDISTAEAALAAAVISTLAVVKGAAASFLGDRQTASLLEPPPVKEN